MLMKVFTNLQKKTKENKKFHFLKQVLVFYFFMMLIYGYMMLANLSTAPKFIYTQF